MATVASRYFNGVGFRGMFMWQGAMRFTLRRFDDQEEAELWTLGLMLRWRALFYVGEG